MGQRKWGEGGDTDRRMTGIGKQEKKDPFGTGCEILHQG